MLRLNNKQENVPMYNPFIWLLFCCMLLVACASVPLANFIEHQGKQVNINDVNTCLQCHDKMKDHSHPVMVSYPPVGKEKEYVPVAKVERAGIKLVNGQVTCIACHDLTNPEPFHPIKNIGNSELCLVCHLK